MNVVWDGQIWTLADLALAASMLTLLAICVCVWSVQALRRRRPYPLRLWQGAEQSTMDRLLERIYRVRVERNRKAVRAARAMDEWHRNPRSDGRLPPDNVRVLKRPARAHR